MIAFQDQQSDPAALSDDELTEALLASDRARSAAEAREVMLLGEFDARNLHHTDGAVNTKTWLAHRADVTGSTAGLMVADARKLRRHPISAEACTRIGTTRVREFIRRVTARTETTFTETEQILINTIGEFTVDDTIRFAIGWDRLVDQDGPEPPEHKPDLSMGATGNGLFGRFSLFDEDAAFMTSAIDQEVDRIYRSEGDEKQPAGQRRAKALINLLRKAAGADDTTTSPARPTVIIHMTLTDLETRAGTCHVDPGGIPLHTETLRRLLCDANVHRFVSGPDRAIIDFGRTQRLVTGLQRLALTARDRHCQFPGCDRPPSMCHAHHIIPWEHGGTTDLPNLTLLCHRHHHAVHEDHFGCQRQPDGTLHFTRPNGTTLHQQPRPG